MPVCPSCSRETVAGRFCAQCGAPLPAMAEIAPTVEHEPAPSPSASPPSGSAPSSVHGRFEPGTRLGSRYRVVGLLGRGGMGEVYRADDLELNQSVALKFLPERVARSTPDLARLRNEVRTARQIAHPNVCRTYDIAEFEGQVFVVMEYIDGEDLSSVLRRLGRPSPDKALEIARQLCLGLGAAHESGVLHRDLKPANIMIDGRGRVRITDFGLAGTEAEIAAEGGVAGTPAYMAPEQFRSGATTTQSDIYSLGLVLYEVFTGKRASDATPRPDSSRPDSDSSVRTPSSLVAGLDPVVERVILRCLERDPARRPQSAYAVFGALPGGDPLAAAVAAGETPSPELVANAGVAGSMRPLHAGLAAAGVIVGLVALSMAQRPLLGGLDRPAHVLSVRAEETLTQATGQAAPRYSSQGFRYAPAAKDSAGHSDSTAAARARFMHTQGGAKQFWRRWSPVPLVTTNIHRVGSGIGEPPQTYPGSGTVVLDPSGRLMALSVVPSAAQDTMQALALDWTALLRSAGRDTSGLVAAMPPATLRVRADTVAAWRVLGNARPETTLVAAALRGRAVQFDTYAGEKPLGDLGVRGEDHPPTVQDWLWLLLFDLLTLVGSIILARHNLKSGRGDVRGALVIGVSVAGLYLMEYLLEVHAGELGVYQTLDQLVNQAPLGHALTHGVTLALGYLAIEPYVRRLWPSVLVTWARLVAGRLTDPIVGRDILIGGAVGIAVQLVTVAGAHLAQRLGLADEPLRAAPPVLAMILGPQTVIAGAVFMLAVAAVRATAFYTLLVILRFILRNNRAAVLAIFILLTLLTMKFGDRTVWLSAAVGLLTTAAGLFVALRYGLVAMIATWFFVFLAEILPWTSDLSTWFAPQTLLSWGLAAAMLFFGFMTAVGGRSLWRDPLGDPVLGASRPPR